MPRKQTRKKKELIPGMGSLKKRKIVSPEERLEIESLNLGEDYAISVGVTNEPEVDPLMLDNYENRNDHFEETSIKTESLPQIYEPEIDENYPTTPEPLTKQEPPSSPNDIYEDPPVLSRYGLTYARSATNQQSDSNSIHEEQPLLSSYNSSGAKSSTQATACDQIQEQRAPSSCNGAMDIDDSSNDQSEPDLSLEGPPLYSLEGVINVSGAAAATNEKPRRHLLFSNIGLTILQPTSSKQAEATELKNCINGCIICSTIKPTSSKAVSLTDELKKKIMASGKPSPPLKLASYSNTNWNFNTKHYDDFLWLTGCESLNKLFCWPCLLFTSKSIFSMWGSRGYSKLDGLQEALVMHATSTVHLRAILAYTSFSNKINESKKPNEVDAREKKEHNTKVSKNREVLQRLIDAVCLLPTLEVSLCGSDESETSSIHKTYLEIVSLISSYDPVLETHLKCSEDNKFTTNEMRCGLIKAVGKVLVSRVKREVQSAKFVSVILDSSKSNLLSDALISTTLRYVDGEGLTRERFIGYSSLSTCNCVSRLYDHLSILNEHFDFQDKLVAVSFDGIALSSYNLEREFGKFRSKYPSALLVHCNASRLNFVLQKYCLKFENCRILFSTLSSIAMFFSKSSKHRDGFASYITENSTLTEPMELNFVVCKEKTVYDHQLNFIGFFNSIIIHPEDWDEDEVVEVQGFSSFLAKFSTTFLLLIFAKLFEHINKLHRAFVDREFEVDFCTELQLTRKQLMFSEHNNFDQLWEEVKQKTEKYSVLEAEIPDSRDEYKNLFGKIIQAVTNHLSDRTTSLSKLAFFDMLNPKNFADYYERFPTDQFGILTETYPLLFNFAQLKIEISVLYSVEEFHNMLPHELVPYLQSLDLYKSFPEAYKLWCLFLTLPNTYGSLDPKFSVSKRLKFVTETLGHQAKPLLAILSIENLFLKKIKALPQFYEDVTDELLKYLKCEALTFMS